LASNVITVFSNHPGLSELSHYIHINVVEVNVTTLQPTTIDVPSRGAIETQNLYIEIIFNGDFMC
jgi:hypothetical protein